MPKHNVVHLKLIKYYSPTIIEKNFFNYKAFKKVDLTILNALGKYTSILVKAII